MTFYKWAGVTFVLMVIFVFYLRLSYGSSQSVPWTTATTILGAGIAAFIAFSVGFFAAMFKTWSYPSSDNKRFWSVPVHNVDEDDVATAERELHAAQAKVRAAKCRKVRN